jgi:hypothetical protein
MAKLSVLLSFLFVAMLAGCSDDSNPPPGDGPRTDAPPSDMWIGDGHTVLDWAGAEGRQDSTPFSCTPGETGMCDDDKNLHCVEGVCTPCPTNYVDCDRQGDCECVGACDGTKCVGGGGGNGKP